MGRPGRYTLSVMAWVAAYAGWSSVIGLVVAAVTGDQPRNVSTGVSALLNVVGPLVPTLVALWFNDWARDGFPSREQQRAARARAAKKPPPAEGTAPPPAAAGGIAAAEPQAPPVHAPTAVPATAAPLNAAPRDHRPLADRSATRQEEPAGPPTVPAHPLGVPSAPGGAATQPGAFPVAPLLRDRD